MKIIKNNLIQKIEETFDGKIAFIINSFIYFINIIVRGYLAEQFDQLLYKYPMIKFIDNPPRKLWVTNIEDIFNIMDELLIENLSISLCPYYDIINEYRIEFL